MKRSKDLFLELMEELFYTDPFEPRNQQEEEDLEQEHFKVIKNNVITNITVGFTKEGFPRTIGFETNIEPTKKEDKLNRLKLDLKKSVESQDFLKAADLNKQIKLLEAETNVNTN